ncbi:MAG: glycoside hydrolase family 95 protein [Clostridiales bacterium]|jgi:alpha-L-fucosidase 2|nr:glycoside hydrolase family 95 protein [Clostridiales bacterium]
MCYKLQYDRPAVNWLEALPIGNGRIAAMVYGGTDSERIQLNEESLWSGTQVRETYRSAPEILKVIRRALFDGKNDEAREACSKYLLSIPPCVRCYETFGDLVLEFKNKAAPIGNYRRELNLSEGVTYARYEKDGAAYTSECFISRKYDALVCRVKSNAAGKINFDLSFTREKDAEWQAYPNGEIRLFGQIDDEYGNAEYYGKGGPHMRFSSLVKASLKGGTASVRGGKLLVRGADETVVYVTLQTDYEVSKFAFDHSLEIDPPCRERIDRILAAGFDRVKEFHIKEFRRQFETVSLNFGDAEKDLTTDLLLKNLRKGAKAENIFPLFFQYGRYLLLSSSSFRAMLPANLQGKWNGEIRPVWGSDYHTNINLQMNYWPAGPANLFETVTPLAGYVKKAAEFGKRTAKEVYFTEGWTFHHTMDVFGRTGVHDSGGVGTFPMAGPWMTLTLWEHYEFTGDENYLKTELYPLLKGSCEFISGFLTPHNGYLVTAPSNSPENVFYYTDDGVKKIGYTTYAATIDCQIIRAVFSRMIYAAERLKEDELFIAELKRKIKKLPPLTISERYGTICEWIEDYEEFEPSHRHISHLFGLYPGDEINESIPEIYEAAKKTVARRLSFGGAETGWSRSWVINFYTRLHNGEAAYEHLVKLVSEQTVDNLFDIHPPFQIDGNFGGAAGIAEMLIQSHGGKIGERVIELLPAIPSAWADGEMSGLKARGNFTVSMKWSKMKVRSVQIQSCAGGVCRLKMPAGVSLKNIDCEYVVTDNILRFETKKGETYRLTYKNLSS